VEVSQRVPKIRAQITTAGRCPGMQGRDMGSA
jgi:hypothetical protein